MNVYQIENTVSAVVLGQYAGDTARDALDRMAQDAGYQDYAALQAVVPAQEGEIAVTEVGVYTDPVVVERMPDYLRASHRAASNWGRYPHNGAERVIVERASTLQWVRIDDYLLSIEHAEYDHIVHDATAADFELYDPE
jgi:hypothetical protein